MSLQLRLTRLENYQSMNIPVMPEGLTPMEAVSLDGTLTCNFMRKTG